MDRQTKLAIAALAVVTALFAGAAVNGPDDDGDALRHPGGLVEWFGAKFAKTPAADPADLSAACRAGDTFVVRDGTCVLKVAAAGKGRRTVRLRTDSDVGVQAPAPGQDTLVRSDAKAGDTVTVTVGDTATDIDLICAGDRTCTLTLVRED
ncbi:hypothetical protein AB0K00_17290 [Dactylosporangium sp. NPDC049525]|uniref:hypothetical protein n=1 Tax=Dactylosporangium sp. NPDC049525 TaxID=3154730 RepID=UPI0034229B8A